MPDPLAIGTRVVGGAAAEAEEEVPKAALRAPWAASTLTGGAGPRTGAGEGGGGAGRGPSATAPPPYTGSRPKEAEVLPMDGAVGGIEGGRLTGSTTGLRGDGEEVARGGRPRPTSAPAGATPREGAGSRGLVERGGSGHCEMGVQVEVG